MPRYRRKKFERESTLYLSTLHIRPFIQENGNIKGYRGIKRHLGGHSGFLGNVLGRQDVIVKNLVLYFGRPTNRNTHNLSWEYWKTLLKGSGNTYAFPKIELCFPDINTYSHYSRLSMRSKYWQPYFSDLMKRTSQISVDNLNIEKEDLLIKTKHIRDKLHWNWTAFPTPLDDERLDYIKEQLYLVKSATILTPKSSLSAKEIGATISLYMTLKNKLPKILVKKVRIDPCLKATASYFKSDYGCDANVSTCCVWPNGVATGCPHHPNPDYKGVVRNVDKMKLLLHRCRNRYDFDACPLPVVYPEIRKKIVKA